MPPTDPPASGVGSTSAGLIARVQARDDDAWRRLVRLYAPLVDRWLRRHGVRGGDAEDVCQDVFVAVARAVGSFRRDRPGDSFRAWLYTITRNKVVDLRRRLAAGPAAVGGSDNHLRVHDVPDLLATESAADRATDLDDVRRRALEAVRAEFEDRTWRMVWAVAVDGRDAADVAREFAVSPSAVRLAKSRVLRRLKEELDGLEP